MGLTFGSREYLTETVEQIAHGPYPAAPEALVNLYVDSRFDRKTTLFLTNEQIAADVESEWQYDQHSAAVETASEAGAITGEQALFMLEQVLRPWFIGRRRANEAVNKQ